MVKSKPGYAYKCYAYKRKTCINLLLLKLLNPVNFYKERVFYKKIDNALSTEGGCPG